MQDAKEPGIIFVPVQAREALAILSERAARLRLETEQTRDAIIGVLALCLPPGMDIGQYEDISDAAGRIVGLRLRAAPPVTAGPIIGQAGPQTGGPQ